jgi:hypothetical protein
MDLIPALSPEHRSPYHIHEWVDILEEASDPDPPFGPPLRALCAVPIRHYKTETTLHGIVRILLRDPSRRIIFLTHSLEAAQARGKRIRQLATAAGVGPERGYDTITAWSNAKGGGVVVMSAEQSKLGLDCHVLIFDDPIDEFKSEDPHVREAVDSTIVHYAARCVRRGKPGPVLGVMSRWHPDDPIGRRLVRKAVRWRYVAYAAILDEGTENERAFAPDVWDLPALKAMREELREKDPTEKLWWSQFMGEPRPQGTDLFGPATFYTQLPTWSYRLAYGLDMAFSLEDGADWFARVAGRLYGTKLYLTHVVRNRLDAHLIESQLTDDLANIGHGPIFSYMSGPEIGTARLLMSRGIPIVRMNARYNKLVRAQKTIRRWNGSPGVPPMNGRAAQPAQAPSILVPANDPAFAGFLLRMGFFRGHDKGRDDDEPDALVSLSDGIMGSAVAGGGVSLIGPSGGSRSAG